MKLSIIIPTKDRCQLLLETMETIAPQLREGVELVIVDASANFPDPKVTARLTPHIRYERGKAPSFDEAYEEAVAAARGEWVWLFSDDDWFKPGKDIGHDEKVGYEIVVRACRAPIQQIADNAGQNGAVIMNKVLENKEANYGYDARLDRYCDMVKEGIIDPTKVVRSALQNAASVSTLLLTSDALVAEIPKEEKKPAGGGGEDMY
jgi:glycosyltransferase involved in cell wall biosynthesis